MGVKRRVRIERNIYRLEHDTGTVSYMVYVAKYIGSYPTVDAARFARDKHLKIMKGKKDAGKPAKKKQAHSPKKTDADDDTHCLSCVFHWIDCSDVCCEYILRTGHSRGCPPGLACDKYLQGNKDRCIRKFGDREWPDLEIVRKIATGKNSAARLPQAVCPPDTSHIS